MCCCKTKTFFRFSSPVSLNYPTLWVWEIFECPRAVMDVCCVGTTTNKETLNEQHSWAHLPSEPSIRPGHGLALRCNQQGPRFWEALHPAPARRWSRRHRLTCHSQGTAGLQLPPAGGGHPPGLWSGGVKTNNQLNKTQLDVVPLRHTFYYLPWEENIFSSTLLHSGEISFDSAQCMALSMTALTMK